ncbi:MAG: hypothetical protein C4K47_04110 [Candidatus Thorarchaeota archaeon]|nr:MAG: hypothetical protein C4K47_04110 [Candidatus Thorarchaeota archaeon]
MLELTVEEARKFILHAQGLRTRRPSKSVVDTVRRIQNVQIDTISVVARSHDLIIRNRLSGYKTDEVWKWERKGDLFEYWDHMMCLLPIEAYPYCTWARTRYTDKTWGSMASWAVKKREILDSVYDRIKKDGAMSSSDFGGRSERSSGWWDWKNEKTALEYLYYTGRLMIAYREGFQKYYDLTERVLPPRVSQEPMPEDEVPRFVASTTLSSLGLASAEDLRLYRGRFPARILWKGKKTEIEKFLVTLLDEGFVEEVSIEGIEQRYFMLNSKLKEINKVTKEPEEEAPIKLLSPFDNVVRERHLPRTLWGFDYKMEAFVPQEKRTLGYYVLPILDGLRFVGGVDAKAHRKESTLELKSLYLEKSEESTAGLAGRLANGLREFADFHNCDSIKVGQVRPRAMKRTLEVALGEPES